MQQALILAYLNNFEYNKSKDILSSAAYGLTIEGFRITYHLYKQDKIFYKLFAIWPDTGKDEITSERFLDEKQTP